MGRYFRRGNAPVKWENGLIEEGGNPWGSPCLLHFWLIFLIFFVGGGGWRLVVGGVSP